MRIGDTITIAAPTQVGEAAFRQWSAPGWPGIDGSSSPEITITENSRNVSDILLVAQYQPVPMDTLCVSIAGLNCPVSSCDKIAINVMQAAHPNIVDTTESNKSYSFERGQVVTLTAWSDVDSIQFDHWSSADTSIDGITSPVISTSTNRNICATANFLLRAECGLCASIVVHDLGNKPVSPVGIGHVLIPTIQPCLAAHLVGKTCGDPLDAKIQIDDPNYELESYTIRRQSGTITETFGGVPQDIYSISPSHTFSPNPSLPGFTARPTFFELPYPKVTFNLVPIQKTLTVYIKMDDDEVPAGNLLKFNNSQLNGVWCLDNTLPHGGQIYQPQGAVHYYKYVLKYLKTETVLLTCGGNQGYSFLKWDNGSPNTDWSTNNSLTLSMSQDRVVTAIYTNPFKLLSLTFWQWPRCGCPGKDQNGGDTHEDGSVEARRLTVPADGFSSYATSFIQNSVPGLWAGDQLVVRHNDWDRSQTVAIDLKFNRPVKLPTSGGTFGITCEEHNVSLTGLNSNQASPGTFPAVCNGSGSISLPNTNARPVDDGSTIRFYLDGLDANTNKELLVWKGQTLAIDVLSSLRSVNNQALVNPGTFLFSTENPDVTWTFDETHVYKSYNGNCTNAWSWVWLAMHREGLACHADPNNNGSTYQGGSDTRGRQQIFGQTCITTSVHDNDYQTPTMPNLPLVSNTDGSCSSATKPWHVACLHCGDNEYFMGTFGEYAGETISTACRWFYTDHTSDVLDYWHKTAQWSGSLYVDDRSDLEYISVTKSSPVPVLSAFDYGDWRHYNGSIFFSATPNQYTNNHWLDYWGAANKYTKHVQNSNFGIDMRVDIK